MPTSSVLLKAACSAVLAAPLLANSLTPESRTQLATASPLPKEEAEAFFHTWLAMIDANSAVEDYLKYLPDGEFEQWSYTNAEIKNVAELRAYFEASWGTIRKNTNVVESIETSEGENGRVDIKAQVDWTAVTADDQTINMPLTYTLAVGRGSSSADPEGQYPKIYRYAIRPSS